MSAPKFIFKNPLTLDTSNVTGKVKGNTFSTRESLNKNDSYNFLNKNKLLFKTGGTNTNLGDLVFILNW